MPDISRNEVTSILIRVSDYRFELVSEGGEISSKDLFLDIPHRDDRLMTIMGIILGSGKDWFVIPTPKDDENVTLTRQDSVPSELTGSNLSVLAYDPVMLRTVLETAFLIRRS